MKTFRPTKRIIIFSVIGFVVVAFAAVAIIYAVGYVGAVSHIKQNLTQVGTAFEAAKSKTGAYPVSLQLTASDKVVLSGGGSFDGVSYCVTGTTTYMNKPIDLHVDSLTFTVHGPQANSCINSTDIAPSSPLELTILSVDPATIILSWSASVSARAYVIQCATDNQFKNDIVDVRVTSTSGLCASLKPASNYYVHVKAMNSTTESKWSSVITTQTAALSVVPINVKVTATSGTEIQYSWDAVLGATSYNLQRSTDINFMGGLASTQLTATSGSLRSLVPGTTYFFHVQAITPGFSTTTAAFSEEVYTKTLQ
jgi:hypothetical protein